MTDTEIVILKKAKKPRSQKQLDATAKLVAGNKARREAKALAKKRESKMTAKAKKHVLCEKPLAPSLNEIDKMIAISKKNKVMIQEATMMRFHPCCPKHPTSEPTPPAQRLPTPTPSS